MGGHKPIHLHCFARHFLIASSFVCEAISCSIVNEAKMINTNSVFYHIYPLGALNAPHHNDFTSPPVSRIPLMIDWLEHIQSLGANAIYLGPVFESTNHGYDTANYYEVDRRLGTNADLTAFSNAAHARGISLVLDGVFNHVGRDFWAFKDLRANQQSSAYKDWFLNVRFDQTNGYGDPYCYDCWQGHQTLGKAQPG